MPTSASDSLNARAGWLVRRWRESTPDESVRTLRGLSARMQELEPGARVDPSRLSRWETGQSRLNLNLLGLLEQALRTPPNLLTATVEGLYRDHDDPLGGRPGLVRPDTWHTDVDQLLSVIERGRHTGATWYDLAALLDASDTLVYLTSEQRARLARHLVDEIPRSVGHAYIQRVLAMCRLLPTRLMRDSLVQTVGEVVVRPHTQAITDVVANLYEAGGDQPLELLLRLSGHEREQVRSAALWALQHLAERGRLPVDLHDRAATVAATAIRDGRPGPAGHGRRLLEQLPSARTGDVPVAPPVPGEHPRTVRLDAALRREGDRACAALHRERDDLLPRIITDALGARGPNLAQEAGLLLLASPLRGAVADHAVDRVRATSPAAGDWWGLLSFVVTAAQLRPVVELAQLVQPWDRDPVFRVIAHVPVAPSAVREVWDGGLIPSREPTGTHLYALGMTAHPSLHVLAHDARASGETRGAAQWWIEHGSAIHE